MKKKQGSSSGSDGALGGPGEREVPNTSARARRLKVRVDVPSGEWPQVALRALFLTAVSIALHELRRVVGRRALRAEPRVTLGLTAAWALGSIVIQVRKARRRRRARVTSESIGRRRSP